MADERWHQIHAQPGVIHTQERRLVTPEIPHPTCPDHCRRHFVEAVIKCRRCRGEAYHVLAHEWPHSEGHYWHSTLPVNGSAAYVSSPVCCGEPMRRVWR